MWIFGESLVHLYFWLKFDFVRKQLWWALFGGRLESRADLCAPFSCCILKGMWEGKIQYQKWLCLLKVKINGGLSGFPLDFSSDAQFSGWESRLGRYHFWLGINTLWAPPAALLVFKIAFSSKEVKKIGSWWGRGWKNSRYHNEVTVCKQIHTISIILQSSGEVLTSAGEEY